MKFSDLKYLVAYIIPITGFMAVFLNGYWSWSTVIFAFCIIPITEFFVFRSTENLSESEEIDRLSNSFFDLLLYVNLPLIYGLIACYFITISDGQFGIYAGTGPEKLGEILPVICDEVLKFGGDVSEGELARAKSQLKAGLLMGRRSWSLMRRSAVWTILWAQ